MGSQKAFTASAASPVYDNTSFISNDGVSGETRRCSFATCVLPRVVTKRALASKGFMDNTVIRELHSALRIRGRSSCHRQRSKT